MNSFTINLHSYHNNHVFLHNFALPNFGKFWFFFFLTYATVTNYFTTFLQNVDVVNLLLVFI